MKNISAVLALTSVLAIAQASNLQINSEVLLDDSQSMVKGEDSMLANPLIITLIVVSAFNIFVFIVVYGCSRCFKLPYQLNMDQARLNFGTRYPHLAF
jgi:hypothetical protein